MQNFALSHIKIDTSFNILHQNIDSSLKRLNDKFDSSLNTMQGIIEKQSQIIKELEQKIECLSGTIKQKDVQ